MAEKKYFIASPESSIYNEYYEWQDSVAKANEIVKDIKEEFDITGSEYILTDYLFVIEDTEENRERFADSICKSSGKAEGRDEWGLRVKRTSVLYKELRKRIKDRGLTIKEKPWVPLYFEHAYGKVRSTLFDYEGSLYGSIEMDSEIVFPEGFYEVDKAQYDAAYNAKQ